MTSLWGNLPPFISDRAFFMALAPWTFVSFAPIIAVIIMIRIVISSPMTFPILTL